MEVLTTTAAASGEGRGEREDQIQQQEQEQNIHTYIYGTEQQADQAYTVGEGEEEEGGDESPTVEVKQFPHIYWYVLL